MTILGCIADDFTGATDLAGILARSGASVSLHIGVPRGATTDSADCTVIALKSRTAPVETAVADALAALAWLREAGCKQYFWKYCSTFDSTTEGNIGPVAEALMRQLGVTQTLYCPAFPENGRTVYQGRLFVNGQPLDESPMRDHPLTPMRDDSLVRLLQSQVTQLVGLLPWHIVDRGRDAVTARLGELASEGISHVVVDALRDADLRTLATASAHMPLLTGGSALALGLPDLYRQRGWLSDTGHAQEAIQVAGGAIVLSGSCSEMTRRQVANFSKSYPAWRLDPLKIAHGSDGVAAVRTWLDGLDPTTPKIVYATAEPESVSTAQAELGRERAGEIVEQALTEIAQYAFALGVRRFVVAGGESSGAVTAGLAISRVTIGPEIAPGVPWTFAECRGEPVALALKSGNFGDEHFFRDAFETLQSATVAGADYPPTTN